MTGHRVPLRHAVARSRQSEFDVRDRGRLGLRSLCLLDESGEGGLIMHGEIGEDLAVDFDPGLVQAIDKSAIGLPPKCNE